MKSKLLPEAEYDVMSALWKSEKGLSASEIVKELEGSRDWTTATAHVLLDRLCKRDYVKCDRSGYVHRYYAAVLESDYKRMESDSFVRRIAGGSVRQIVASLIEAEPLSDSDIDELTEILNRKRGGNK